MKKIDRIDLYTADSCNFNFSSGLVYNQHLEWFEGLWHGSSVCFTNITCTCQGYDIKFRVLDALKLPKQKQTTWFNVLMLIRDTFEPIVLSKVCILMTGSQITVKWS